MILTSKFDEHSFGEAVLTQILEWVIEHYDPTELFGEDVVKEHVRDEYEPEDVFIHHNFVLDEDE